MLRSKPYLGTYTCASYVCLCVCVFVERISLRPSSRMVVVDVDRRRRQHDDLGTPHITACSLLHGCADAAAAAAGRPAEAYVQVPCVRVCTRARMTARARETRTPVVVSASSSVRFSVRWRDAGGDGGAMKTAAQAPRVHSRCGLIALGGQCRSGAADIYSAIIQWKFGVSLLKTKQKNIHCEMCLNRKATIRALCVTRRAAFGCQKIMKVHTHASNPCECVLVLVCDRPACLCRVTRRQTAAAVVVGWRSASSVALARARTHTAHAQSVRVSRST